MGLPESRGYMRTCVQVGLLAVSLTLVAISLVGSYATRRTL
jgi:hypothetical protein